MNGYEFNANKRFRSGFVLGSGTSFDTNAA
jgi:hypothetical protein